MKLAGQYYVPDHETVQLDALSKGAWQLDHLITSLAWVTDWSLAVDGGAHVGSWSLEMAKRFAKVHAFEPAKDTFECLWMNTQDVPNIQRHALALGEEHGSWEMEEDERYSGGNTGGRHLQPKKDGPVATISLDELDLPSLGFLKLDVEGFELFALRGAKQTIRKFRPVVMIENKRRMALRYGLHPDDAPRYLGGLGMTQVGKIGDDLVFAWPK